MALRERHNQLIHIYREHTNNSSSTSNRTTVFSASDRKTLEEQHEFVRDDDDDEANAGDWGVRMARKYWNKMFKEYAICDLTLFQTGRIGMRWRVEKEVILGKGQFVCGNKHCDSTMDLHSYEIPFTYMEKVVSKTELVKCRVCLECAKVTNYLPTILLSYHSKPIILSLQLILDDTIISLLFYGPQKLFHEKLQRLTHQSKHGDKQKKNHGSIEEWQQELSHDDIVRVLFDLGSAAECKEEDSTTIASSNVSVDEEMHTKDSKHIDTHPRKKVKRSKSTVEEEQERDQLQQLLV